MALTHDVNIKFASAMVLGEANPHDHQMSQVTPGRLTNIVPETTTLAEQFQRSEQLEVPDLQRRVAWIANNFDQLMDDIDAYASKPASPDVRYIGSFLVQPDNSGPVPRQILVDGQQRTLVTQLMVATMAHLYETEFSDPAAAKFLREEYMTIATRGGRKPKVVLTELDNPAFQKLTQNPTATTNHEAMNKLANQIRESFDERVNDVDDLRYLEELILERQAVVVINIGDQFSPYRIFEERNGRGAQLTPVDRVKNRILEVADADPSVDFDLVKDEWHEFRRALDGHNETRALRYITMAGDLVPVNKKISGGDLYPTIKHIVDERLDDLGIGLLEYVEWLTMAAETYSDIASMNYQHPQASKSQADEINRHLEALDTIGAKPGRILLMGGEFRGVSPTEFKDITILVEKFSFVRRTVERRVPQEIQAYLRLIHGSTSKGISPAFSQSNPVQAVKKGLEPEMPSKEEFRREFARKDWNKGAKTAYALTVLEHEHYLPQAKRHSGFGGPMGRADIEHIIPQRYDAKKYQKWHNYLAATKEELELDVSRIGNLTLLEDRKNIKASDDPFEQKRDPHYLTSGYAMANDLANRYSSWDLDKVDERSKEMAKTAAGTWVL